MLEVDHSRVRCCGPNGYGAFRSADRCRAIINNAENYSIASINDAIEIHEIKLVYQCLPAVFEDNETSDAFMLLFGEACRYVKNLLSSVPIDVVYEGVERQYGDRFWSLVFDTNLYDLIDPEALCKLLDRHSLCIGHVLSDKKMASQFDSVLRETLINHVDATVGLIVGRLGSDGLNKKELYLPPSLSSSDIDGLMLTYLTKDDPNPNYCEILSRWPSRSVKRYRPSARVMVTAKRAYEKSRDSFFSENGGMVFGTEVAISDEQSECIDCYLVGNEQRHVFGKKWLTKYLDAPSIMNNCIYVFDYLDEKGFLYCPAHAHEQGTLMNYLGMHAVDEYRTGVLFNLRGQLVLAETCMYADLLKEYSERLESAIEWVYNDYFVEEFRIKGFSLSLPAESSSWLDKCKSMGPEIERVLKAYSLYSKNKEIDGDYFRFESVKLFYDFESLNGRKYAVEGDCFQRVAFPLLSDQSLLAYVPGIESTASNLYELLTERPVRVEDYEEPYQQEIIKLVDTGFLAECEGDNRLLPTFKAKCVKTVWDKSAYPLNRASEKVLLTIEILVKDGILRYSSKLFTPDEAAYLNYMFNDAAHSNALALRNKYDHGNEPVSDPNSGKYKKDYYQLLALLIGITLKINDEFVLSSSEDIDLDLIEWPLYGGHIMTAYVNVVN